MSSHHNTAGRYIVYSLSKSSQIFSVTYNILTTSSLPGTLNLQNREMTVIPDDVYKLNDPELLQTLVGSDDDLKWWETEPIAKLYLCSNKIT